METVRQRRTQNMADLLADWSEKDLHTLGVTFKPYNRAVAAKHLMTTPPVGAQP